MKCNGRECLRRALRTFVQSALGYIAVDLVSVVQNNTGDALASALRGLLVSAAAAGIAAIMNLPSRTSEKSPADNVPDTDVKGEDGE